MNKGYEKIVVIDFETTGLSSKKRAVEVAWFELNEKFEVIDEQSSLINPMIPIPSDASKPNHKLETISKFFNFSTENSHRARSDALQVVKIM